MRILHSSFADNLFLARAKELKVSVTNYFMTQEHTQQPALCISYCGLDNRREIFFGVRRNGKTYTFSTTGTALYRDNELVETNPKIFKTLKRHATELAAGDMKSKETEQRLLKSVRRYIPQ